MTVAQWAEKFRFLSAETSALPGRYSLTVTPYLRGILEAITDRRIRKLCCMKSAQVGWTDGVINNFVGYVMHLAPAPVGVMFPRDQNAKDYNVEKFAPMVEATPVLNDLVNTKTRSLDNTQNRKKFAGGFIKFFGSNSTGGVKSTPLKVVVIEEPDDCNLNIKGQGDSIKLAEERVKTFHDSKVLAGGTPSIKGVSSIEAEMEVSDKRYFLVPCHDCDEAHALEWENVKWSRDETVQHPVFGDVVLESTRYACPHCGSLWTDAAKNRNIRRAEAAGFGWTATAPFNGVAGFYLNELYSSFSDSRLARLVEKYLTAVHEANLGELGALIAFWNSSLGLPYEYQTDTPEAEDLASRAEAYDEDAVPWGGLVLTAGVDVQHDRLAVIVRAWGRGEESWLVYWGEIHGATITPEAGAWVDLDALLTKDYVHASGRPLRIRAASIDSSDGTTQDAVYTFVRKRQGRGLLAIKGASEATADRREIYSRPPQSIDTDKKGKAFKYGLKNMIVGTSRAKDLILGGEGAGRIALKGSGPGRMHWYRTVRPDYWAQLTSEIKAPHRTVKNRKVWQKKSGVRNEALDCEVYALHAARSLKTNLWKDATWSMLDASIRQGSLLAAGTGEEQQAATVIAADSGATPTGDESGGLDVGRASDSANESPPPHTPPRAQHAPRPARQAGRVGRSGFTAGRW